MHPDPFDRPVPVRFNIELLDQAAEAVDRLSHLYSEPLPGGRSPVGAHIRHVIDHYDCLFNGVDGGRIDYYRRQRDADLEGDPRLAKEGLARLRTRCSQLSDADIDGPVLVATGGPDHGDGESGWAPSSVRRELAFVLSHTLHHLAMIRGMALELGIEIGGNVGVAHSTLANSPPTGGPAPGEATGGRTSMGTA